MADFKSVVLDIPLPPSVNKVRKINWANYAKYKHWQQDADKTLMLHQQNRQTPLRGPYQLIIDVDYDSLFGDLDNIVKAIIDYCVSRSLVDGDGKKFLKGFTVRFSAALPEGCRVTLLAI